MQKETTSYRQVGSPTPGTVAKQSAILNESMRDVVSAARTPADFVQEPAQNTDLGKPHNFVDDAAMSLAATGHLPSAQVLEMLRLLDAVRDVTSATSLVLRMVINADVLEFSEGPKPQVSRTDLYTLQTLCQVSQRMLEAQTEKLIRDINDVAETSGRAQ